MGTRENPGQFDCYSNALPSEPLFILLARDESAPDIVVDWAMRRLAAIRDGRKPPSDIPMLREALNTAVDMVAWRVANRGSAAQGQGAGTLPAWHNRQQHYAEQREFVKELSRSVMGVSTPAATSPAPAEQVETATPISWPASMGSYPSASVSRLPRCGNCGRTMEETPLPNCTSEAHKAHWEAFAHPIAKPLE